MFCEGWIGFHFLAFSGSNILNCVPSVLAYAVAFRRLEIPYSSALAAAPIAIARRAAASLRVVWADARYADANQTAAAQSCTKVRLQLLAAQLARVRGCIEKS